MSKLRKLYKIKATSCMIQFNVLFFRESKPNLSNKKQHRPVLYFENTHSYSKITNIDQPTPNDYDTQVTTPFLNIKFKILPKIKGDLFQHGPYNPKTLKSFQISAAKWIFIMDQTFFFSKLENFGIVYNLQNVVQLSINFSNL